jgi:soluble lytic murein transglycosylase-like protein
VLAAALHTRRHRRRHAEASIRLVPPETILAVIRIESGFDVNAESDAGAIG